MASTHSSAAVGNTPLTPAEAPSIDGVQPSVLEYPTSANEVADLLVGAAADRLAVAPVGGGTMLSLGNVPEHLDIALSTARLDRVLHYEPTDLTLAVEAGARFGDVQALLAEQGQGLPIEVPNPEDVTIGGMVATAFAGPRRLGAGTLRDLIIGIVVAYADGSVAKAGGLVVKNVTGFDLMRLHHGALGTLGVVTSVNFKVLPRARAEQTLIFERESLNAALDLARTARSGRSGPLALEISKGDGAWQVAIRWEGRPSTVGLLSADLVTSAGAPERALVDEESASWWREFGQGQRLNADGDAVVVRAGTNPGRTGLLAGTCLAACDQFDITPETLNLSPGLGTVTIRFALGGRTPAEVAALQQYLLEAAASVTFLTAPPAAKRGLDVWGRPPATLDVMRSLKQEFDPNRVLNPGRYVCGI